LAPVFEVLIGLFLVYAILSVVVSAVNEGLAGLFGWRSTYLERGIKSLLGAALAGDFFKHDLIRSLSNEDAWLRFSRKPSYVSASTFTETVLDFVRKGQPQPEANSPANPPAVRSDDLVLNDLRDRLRTETVAETGIAAETGAPILPALQIFSAAAKDLDDFKKRVDAWYEEAMDRVAGWYKRFTRLLLFLMGIVLVLVLNADSINIATSLWREAPIRTAAVEQAGTVAGDREPNPDQAVEQLRRLEELNLPLGWVTGEGREADPRRWPVDFPEYVIKLLGLLITAFALSFGATFWFDLLKKFVGIRSSGAEPQPAQTGPPSGAAEQPQRLEISVARGSIPGAPDSS
jgi:hypothetical protein